MRTAPTGATTELSLASPSLAQQRPQASGWHQSEVIMVMQGILVGAFLLVVAVLLGIVGSAI